MRSVTHSSLQGHCVPCTSSFCDSPNGRLLQRGSPLHRSPPRPRIELSPSFDCLSICFSFLAFVCHCSGVQETVACCCSIWSVFTESIVTWKATCLQQPGRRAVSLLRAWARELYKAVSGTRGRKQFSPFHHRSLKYAPSSP